MESKKYQNLYTKQTHRYKRQTSSYQKVEGVGRGKQRYGIRKYKLLCIKSISNKNMLYNKGKYSHYLIIITSNRV